MLPTGSRLREDGDWTWLEPGRASLLLVHAAASVVVSVLLVAAAAAATLPPPVAAVPLVVAIALVGARVVVRTWRTTHSRVAVSPLGLAVVAPTDASQVGWPAVLAVTGQRRGRRVRVRIVTRDEVLGPPVTFAADAARAWLAECTRLAASRRLDPVPADDLLGFVAGDAARR